jgi:hypothetical protein
MAWPKSYAARQYHTHWGGIRVPSPIFCLMVRLVRSPEKTPTIRMGMVGGRKKFRVLLRSSARSW